jgi:hypothetical protein
LRLHATDAPRPDAELTLFRRSPDGDARTLQTTQLSDTSASRLADAGLRFVDRSIGPPGDYTYRLRLKTPGSTERWSEPTRVAWREPPPAPEDVHCQAVAGRLVEIEWSPDKFGALIFRKSVTDHSSDFTRLGLWRPDARGLAADRDIQPDGVYAYRLALAIRTTTFTQFGRTGPPVYVSM